MEDHINFLGKRIASDIFGRYILFLAVTIVCLFLARSYWGTDSLGSFFQRSEYTVQYYVYLQPENAQSKNYRVVADIAKSRWYEQDGEDNYGGNSYTLNKVYWPDGGTSEFDSCELWDAVENSKSVTCTTTEKATTYQIRLGEKVLHQ